MKKEPVGTEAQLMKKLLDAAHALESETLTKALCAAILHRSDLKERQLRRIASACLTAPETNPN